jgi:hypothetical protein
MGSDATRVTPSSSVKYAFPDWMPRSVVTPAEEIRSRNRFGSHATSATPVPPSGVSEVSRIRTTWDAGSGFAPDVRR